MMELGKWILLGACLVLIAWPLVAGTKKPPAEKDRRA